MVDESAEEVFIPSEIMGDDSSSEPEPPRKEKRTRVTKARAPTAAPVQRKATTIKTKAAAKRPPNPPQAVLGGKLVNNVHVDLC